MKGIWKQMQETNKPHSNINSFFDDLQKMREKAPPRTYQIQTGTYGMITMSLFMDPASNGIRFFSEYPSNRLKGARDYIWFTPYFKGNLWKIRIYLSGKIEVYHGTVKLIYASNLKSAIDKIPAHRDDKYTLWKIKMKQKLRK